MKYGIGLILLICLLICLYVFDSTKNRGWDTGYYGDFNRSKKALNLIDGVKISNEWANLDITLEEFKFDIIYKGEIIRLTFLEDNKIRNMNNKDASAALLEWIENGNLPDSK